MDHKVEVFECLSKMSDQLDKILDEAARIQRVLSNDRAALNSGKPIGSLDTLFGITDLAGMVNTASRWEGRLFERLDLGYEAELAERGHAEQLNAIPR